MKIGGNLPLGLTHLSARVHVSENVFSRAQLNFCAFGLVLHRIQLYFDFVQFPLLSEEYQYT